MTLLDKQFKLIKPGLALLLIPFFFACDDPTELGLELEPTEEKVKTEKIEFTLPASSIYIDSLRTDDFPISIFGQYEDSIYGKVTAKSYNQYDLGGGPLPSDSLSYVSTHLILKINDVRAMTNLTGETISIYEADDTLHNGAAYFADRHIDYDASDPIATHTFSHIPRHDSIDTYLNIPLEDSFGQWLYERLDDAQAGSNTDSLLQGLFHYPPLVFVPGTENKGLFSIDLSPDTVAIYINMQNIDGEISSFTFDFGESPHFTHLDRDKNSGKLSDLSADYAVSTVPSGRTYLDMLNGVGTKIELKPLLDFIESHDDIIINSSELSLGVADYHQLHYVDEVSPIYFLFMKENGRINGASLVAGQLFNNAILRDASYSSNDSRSIMTMSYDAETMLYKNNVTLFTQVLADYFSSGQDYLTKELVVLSPQTLNLGQTSFNKSEIKLTVFYTSLTN